MPWLFFALAVVAELAGTLGLRQLANHTTPWSIAVIACAYVISFSSLSFALRSLNVGVVYALWSGIGTAAVAVAGLMLFGERLSWQALAGMGLIVLGAGVLLTSGTVSHA